MKVFVWLSILFYPLTQLSAQTSIGFSSGVNMAKVMFKPSIDQETVVAYTGGIVFKHFEEKFAGVQLELNYAQKGWKEMIDTVQYYKRKINYIEVPCMSQFYLGATKLRLFLNIGFLVGYGFSAKEWKQSTDSLETGKYSFTSTDNRADLGLTGGLGMLYESVIGSFQLEGRFSQSLSNIQTNTNSRNQVIGITLAYLVTF